MRIIPNYLAKSILFMTTLAAFVLLSLDLFFGLVSELRSVGTGDYQLFQALVYLLFTIPQRVYLMFPLSALIGTLLALGNLASHHELVAIFSAGVSAKRLIFEVLKFGVILTILITLFGEIVAPHAQQIGLKNKAFAMSGGQAVQTPYGTWMRDGPSFIHIQKFQRDGYVEGITRYQFDENLKLQKSSFASYGRYENDHWELFHIKESDFYSDHVKTKKLPHTRWDSMIKPEVLNVVGVEHLERLNLVNLYRNIRYREANSLDTEEYLFAFWEKVLQPLSTLVMILIAIPFIFGPLRSVTMGMRLVAGILVGFGFHTLNSIFGPLVMVYDVSPFLGALLPPVLFGIFGVWLMQRTQSRNLIL